MALLKVALIGALLMAGAKPPKAPKPEPKPTLQVGLLLPRGFVMRGDTIDVSIRAYDPNHELFCPAYHIDCNDGRGHISSGLSDCSQDASPRPEDRPLTYTLPERVPVKCGPYWAPGEYAVRGRLTDATHGRGQASSEIVVIGLVQVAGKPLPPAQIAEAGDGH